MKNTPEPYVIDANDRVALPTLKPTDRLFLSLSMIHVCVAVSKLAYIDYYGYDESCGCADV